jgi:ABC-type iron transport system FetAB ATPase subunit
MLDKTTANLDKTNTRMIAIDNNMKRLLQKTNQNVLWVILCLEVVVLLLLIFL